MKPPALLAIGLVALLAAAAWADEPARAGGAAAAAGERAEFLRLSRDERDRPLSLDTSIVTYGRPDGGPRAGVRPPLQVDLVAAVHVGSESYYDTLDRLFADYDAVLYELVAPVNSRPQPGAKGGGAIGTASRA